MNDNQTAVLVLILATIMNSIGAFNAYKSKMPLFFLLNTVIVIADIYFIIKRV